MSSTQPRKKNKKRAEIPLACLINHAIELLACCCKPRTTGTGHKNDRSNARAGQAQIRLDLAVSTTCRGQPCCSREWISQDVLKTAIASHTTYKPSEGRTRVRA